MFAALAAPALSQAPQASQAIAGAGRWLSVDSLPGVAGHACSARVDGTEVDVMLLLNRDQLPVLVAGHRDWHELLGEADIKLSIDAETPVPLKAQMINNLVMLLVSDGSLVERLRRARTLDWTMPFGRFHSEVTGLGTALDEMKSCRDHWPAGGSG
jgi:hypothetical protein